MTNLKTWMGVDSSLNKLDGTGQLSHQGYYSAIINRLGYEKVIAYLPVPVEELAEKIEKDEYLNNIPLRKWDLAGYGLRSLLQKNGITAMSKADLVCILKQAARMAVIKMGAEEMTSK